MSNIPWTPRHDNRSNMSSEQDDQDIELVEHQQLNRGAGLQTYESNVPLNIDQEERMGRQLFSTGVNIIFRYIILPMFECTTRK